MPTVFTDFEEEAKKLIDPNREKAKADSNAFYDSQVASTNKLYDAQAEKAGKSYEDSYRENAVQKLINERQVAENMANLGHTNSGLNRTQQTAVQLSYANQKANIDRQRQNNLDDINLSRTQALDTIEQNRLSSAASIDQDYDKLISETATTNYNNHLDFLSEQSKIAQKQSEAAQKQQETAKKDLYYFRRTEKDKLGNNVYVFSVNGKEVKLQEGVNPYTGTNNKIEYSAEAKKIGFFSNGYQPRGLVSQGGAFEWTGDYYYGTGKQQKIWKAPNGKEFVWYGDFNEYREVER